MSLLIALLALAATPVPSEVRTFHDWTVACDNGLGCEAVALLPDPDGPDIDWAELTTLVLRRGAGATDRPALMLPNLGGEPAALLADGRPVPVRFVGSVDGATVTGDDAVLVETLKSAHVLEVRDAAGASLGRISLSGASAAMLYMDEKQRRLDTVTAMVRPGPRPASAVPTPPPLPQVPIAAAPTDEALTIPTSVVARLRRQYGCLEYDTREDSEFETFQIETGKTLVLIPCGSGAYNFSSVPVIAQSRGGRLTTAVAPFDRQWAIAREGHPILVNAAWDAETRRLQEYSKGRGWGDCGSGAEYGWDGSRFRLIHQQVMEECRGSVYFVTTWRAETVER